MAKARFPGRSLKSYNRKRVSTYGHVNYRESQGFRAAEDAYFRLSVFDHLFPEENEAPLFHGFSPHDVRTAVKEQAVHEIRRNLAESTERPTDPQPVGRKSKPRSSAPPIRDKGETRPEPKKPTASPEPKKPTASSEPKKPTASPEPKTASAEPKKSAAPVVTGTKFVLPSRSAHSSRVIKPNKRFLQSSSPERNSKRPRIDEPPKADAAPAKTPQSPVKFVLQKPKLKIDSEPFTVVEGPFSSQSTSLPPVKSKETASPSTKVICGVCGSVWYWKHVKQARKFGIFSCDPCRRFITKILKALESKSLELFPCATRTGNCTIRQFTLGSSTHFPTEKHPENNASSRCQGCWLNLCLRSYYLASDVVRRLSKYLPPEIPYRPGPPSESKKSGLRSGDVHLNSLAKSPAENTSLKEVKPEKEAQNPKSGKGKIKLPISGPRIKHVCRSASLVLGQPVPATFDDKGSIHGEANETLPDDSDISSNKCDDVSLNSLIVGSDIQPERASQPDIDYDYERPVARMLQDLGKDNCDLLDGMERHEYEKKFAKIAVDFWESYDPDEVSLSGFPLIGYGNMNLRALCFLCGSAGLEKLVHCSSCCEAYHTFCASALKTDNSKESWWKLDWLCPKCTECQRCFKYGGSQLSCANCLASYHFNCVLSGRANVLDNNWMCPDCLRCKSCNNPEFHVFVGNLPLCNACFNLRKKGNFCPLCQVCYDDDDYDTKMMECAECKKWVHAKCERISDEKYQILSYLPSSIEFVCRVCCKDPPPLWMEAVNAQLKLGLLNVIKALGKNQVVCNLVKASPMKKSCSCRSYKPVVLKNLNVPDESPPKTDSESSTSDDRAADLNLLTPKLTKDDEECLESAKSGLINLVRDKAEGKNYPTVYDFREDVDDLPITRFEHRPRSLLSIASLESGERTNGKSSKLAPSSDAESPDRVCGCDLNDSSAVVLTVMEIKKRIQSNHYLSVKNFNEDMTQALEDIHADSVKAYRGSLKHVFPWFDPDHPLDTSLLDDSCPSLVEESPSKISTTKAADNKVDVEKKPKCTWNDLLVHNPDYYYVNFKMKDTRTCMFCKEVGEGLPSKEGRLLYCGHNEWVHVNCALWSSEVFEEIDGSLQNVQSAISRSRMIRCCFCDKKGASVGCCARSCPSAYHLSCAIRSNCVFLSNKEVYCKNHSHMRGKKDLQNPEDFCVSRPVYVELDQKKRKEILHSEVKLAIGSLCIHLLGEIVPEYSDLCDVIVPCNFRCARWFWSSEEPWRLVRYYIETKTISPACEYSVDQDINVTIKNSSVGITPPPSPRDPESRLNYDCIADRVEIRNLVCQLVDTVCAREEESNLAEQQATDLLPPDIEEAIFKDLPHDILDGIDMHDIFPKMSFDDFSECKIDKAEVDSEAPPNRKLSREETKSIDSKVHKITKIQKSRKLSGVDNGTHSRDCEPYSWKTSNILQLDGAVDDSSDSEQSVDFCGPQSMDCFREDEPVKCGRCHRTYRSSIGYDRHLPECHSDFSSDSDSGEEEQVDVKQNLDVHVGCFELVEENDDASEHTMEEPYENSSGESDDDSCDSQTTGRLDVIVDVYQDCVTDHVENGVTMTEVTDAVNMPQSSAIIVQEVPHETVMPQFMPTFSSQPAIQQPEIQYFSPPNPNGFHYPGSVASTVIPSVQPAMLGAIVQSGVDQIVLNSPSPVYHQPPQNNVYIANPSMVVGMETVVSNTVMSSSQFIPGVPGMLASSYSTTTTQVFHAAKPQIDMPSNFVVVNAQPVHQPVVNHSAPSLTNMPNFVQDNISAGTPWNNYQMNIQESHLVGNNCSSYQTVTRKIVHEHKNVDGVKMINSTQETVFIEPIVHTNSIQQQYNCSVKNFPHIPQPIVEKETPVTSSPKPSQPKVVELPRMPTTNREKPQQAVAPVVIKQIVNPTPSFKTLPISTVPMIEKTEPKPEQNPPISKKPYIRLKVDELPEENGVEETAVTSPDGKLQETKSPGSPPPPPSPPEPKVEFTNVKLLSSSLGLFSKEEKPHHKNGLSIKTLSVQVQQPKNDDNLPKITYEVTSEDGFSCSTSDIHSAWEKIYNRVQNSRKSRGLPPLGKNPFVDPNSVLKKAIGLGNNSVKFIVEQLPGASSCTNYRPAYHKKKLSALEQELSRNRPKENYSGCARADIHLHKKHTYDMFSWLASRHRRPPKLTTFDVDLMNSNRRASLSLPIAMRFRYLKETSKHTVGVFRSDIHGRGLFCLRDIESGEMVIEYAGEVIRSSLTDMRERFYTDKGIGCYMFRIDDKCVIDATMKGNAARFINHSCEPNCFSKVVDIFGKKHIVIFALRKIIQGEELTYDYKFPLEEDKIKCHCLSKKCRKYLN